MNRAICSRNDLHRLRPQARARTPSIGGARERVRPRPGRALRMTFERSRPEPHPLGQWRAQPRYNTTGEMAHMRHLASKPHRSYDIDGDGVVSSMDFYLASQFDVNQDGRVICHPSPAAVGRPFARAGKKQCVSSKPTARCCPGFWTTASAASCVPCLRNAEYRSGSPSLRSRG